MPAIDNYQIYYQLRNLNRNFDGLTLRIDHLHHLIHLLILKGNDHQLSQHDQATINEIYRRVTASSQKLGAAMQLQPGRAVPRIHKGGHSMADQTIDDTLTAVTAEDTRVDSIIAFLQGVQQQLKDALAGMTIPPAVQAKINTIFATATASAAKIDTALNANVPPPTSAP